MSKLQDKGVYSSVPAPHAGQSTPSPAFPPQHRIPTAQRCSDGFYLWTHSLWLSHTPVTTPLCFEGSSLMENLLAPNWRLLRLQEGGGGGGQLQQCFGVRQEHVQNRQEFPVLQKSQGPSGEVF